MSDNTDYLVQKYKEHLSDEQIEKLKRASQKKSIITSKNLARNKEKIDDGTYVDELGRTYEDVYHKPKKASCPDRAYRYLIRLLAKRDYSEHKLTQKLKQKGYNKADIEVALTKVKDQNFLREDNYIESRVKGLLRKGYSPSLTLQKLRIENIDLDESTIIDMAHSNGIDLEQIKEELIAKKERSLPDNIDEFKKRQKIAQFLASKGHYQF